MNLKSTLILALIVTIVSAGLTRYLFPRIETQTVDVVHEVIKKDIRTITKIVEKPDGTKETTIDETDKSTDKKTEKHTETTYQNKDWQVAGTAETDYTQLQEVKLDYGVHIQRRILGPFYLGALINTNKQVGVSLGLEF